MKKIVLLISVLSLALFTACSSQKETNTQINKEPISTAVKEQDVREIAYNQLTKDERQYIKGTWKDGELRKLTLTANMGAISDKSYIGKEVYLVDFKTKNDNPTRNNMGVFVSIEDYKIIGHGYND